MTSLPANDQHALFFPVPTNSVALPHELHWYVAPPKLRQFCDQLHWRWRFYWEEQGQTGFANALEFLADGTVYSGSFPFIVHPLGDYSASVSLAPNPESNLPANRFD